MKVGRRLGSSRGAELVEFAIILPLLLTLVGGIIDFALMMQAFEAVSNAAREGARMGTLAGYNLATDVPARVNSYLTAANLPGGATTTASNVTIAAGGAGAPAAPGVSVTVAYPYTFRMIGSIVPPVTLTSTAVMRKEPGVP